MELDENEIT